VGLCPGAICTVWSLITARIFCFVSKTCGGQQHLGEAHFLFSLTIKLVLGSTSILRGVVNTCDFVWWATQAWSLMGCTCVVLFVPFRSFSVHFRSFIWFVHFSSDKIKYQELVTIYNIKLRNRNKNNWNNILI
jgi:hypothetical protein